MKQLSFFLLALCTLCACSAPKATEPTPQAVIFETDMGNDIDDAMALDLLFKNMDQGNINLLAVSVHKNNPYSAEYIDIMRHWYGYPNLPIGVNTACVTDMDCVDYCTKVALLKNDKGEPMFKRSENPQYEEAVDMYRRILAEQADGSVVIATVGFSTTMAQLLQSQADKYSSLTGKELVAKKVKCFSIMAGEFVQENFREYNIWNDLEASKYFFDESPVPMVIVPWTLGDQIQYPGSSIATDFAWSDNPMVEGYKAYLEMPYDRPTWDVISALYACHPDFEGFTLSGKGEVKVVGEGITEWRDDENGRYQILVPTETQRQQILDYFVDILTTKPKHMQ